MKYLVKLDTNSIYGSNAFTFVSYSDACEFIAIVLRHSNEKPVLTIETCDGEEADGDDTV